MMPREPTAWSPRRGDRVRVVLHSRYQGRAGTLVRWESVQSGQYRTYPVVRLDATPQAAAREVRMVLGSLGPEARL